MIYELISMKDRVSLITGGAGHLGRAMASALAEIGSSVVIVDLDLEMCQVVADELTETFNVPTLPIGVDLTNEDALRTIVNQVDKQFGRLDVLVNNAAYVGTSALKGWAVPFEEQTSESWRKAFDINLTAVFNLTQAFEPLLKDSMKGSIINIASIYGIVGPDLRLYAGTGMGNPAAYAASKGGLIQFTRWCATALAPNIRVNAITPGGISRNQAKDFVERYVSRTPLGRMASENDFLGAVAYLASDLSAYVTGHNLVVDGGWSVW